MILCDLKIRFILKEIYIFKILVFSIFFLSNSVDKWFMKYLCIHNVSIHIVNKKYISEKRNFEHRRALCNVIWHLRSNFNYEKNVSYNSYKILLRSAFKQKLYITKSWFLNTKLPIGTFHEIYVRLLNISIHRNLYIYFKMISAYMN